MGPYHLKGMFLRCLLLWNIQLLASTCNLATSQLCSRSLYISSPWHLSPFLVCRATILLHPKNLLLSINPVNPGVARLLFQSRGLIFLWRLVPIYLGKFSQQTKILYMNYKFQSYFVLFLLLQMNLALHLTLCTSALLAIFWLFYHTMFSLTVKLYTC